jgi:phosphopantetheinyl transferase
MFSFAIATKITRFNALQSNSKLFFMPFFYQQNINDTTHFALWKIEEPISYFEEEMHLLVDIQNEERKIQHLAVRWLLALMMPEIDVSNIKVADNGKPYIPGAGFHFSLSHCKGFAACAISETKPVGIDIEVLHDRMTKVAHKFLHEEEKSLVSALPAEMQLSQLAFYWAAKEAIYKQFEKNGIDFSHHFNIPELALEKEGIVSARINHQGNNAEVKVKYLFKDNFVCTVCFES